MPRDRLHGGQRGGVLLGLVAALVLAGVLGAAAASLLGTASLHEVRANFGERAYYLAESGFRYAASMLRDDNTEATAFWALDGDAFEVPAGGGFALALSRITADEGYDSEHWVDGDQSIAAHGDLVLEAGAQPPPRNGLLVYEGSWYRYREFRDDTLVDVIAAPNNQRLVAGDQDVTPGQDHLALQPGSIIPAVGHIFYHDGIEYAYDEYANDVLRGITPADLAVIDGDLLDFPSVMPLEVVDGDFVLFAPLIRVDSTGEYPGPTGGDLNVRRRVSYWYHDAAAFPEEMEGGGFIGGASHDDMAGFADSWEAETIGEFGYDGVEEAVRVDAVANVGLASLAFQGGEIVSSDYEAQVKIKIADDPAGEYLAGITFRMDGQHHREQHLEGYGVSYARWNDGGNLPESIVPEDFGPGGDREGEPFVVFWRIDRLGQGQGQGQGPELQLLAWAPTPAAVEVDGLIKEWSTLLVRVEEVDVGGEPANRIQVMAGDPDYHPRVNELPLSWPPENGFHLIDDWEVEPAGNATLVEGGVRTDPGELLFADIRDNREVGVHAWGENMNGNAWFDNFAVREAGQDAMVFGGGYIPPLQQ